MGPVDKVVIELKVLRQSLEQTIAQGLEQTARYVQRTGAADAHLVVFDRRDGVSWDDKVFVHQERHEGLAVTVWGM